LNLPFVFKVEISARGGPAFGWGIFRLFRKVPETATANSKTKGNSKNQKSNSSVPVSTTEVFYCRLLYLGTLFLNCHRFTSPLALYQITSLGAFFSA
jgi:hypothetical protein